jgi:cell division septation protein DedD
MIMIDDRNLRTTQSENLDPDSEVGEARKRPASDELVGVIGHDDLFNSMRKNAAEAEQRATDRRPAIVHPGSLSDWLSRARPDAGEFRCSSGEASQAKHARAYPHDDPLGEALLQPVRVDGADDAQNASGAEGDGHDPGSHGSYLSTDDQEAASEQSYAGNLPGDDPYPHAGASGYQETYEQPLRERRRGSLITVAAVLGLAIVGTAGAFGYGAFTGSGSWTQPAVIRADNMPTSIATSPSSSDGQGSKLIHERADKSQPERVVSQGQPIELKDAAPKVLTAILTAGPRETSSQTAMDYAPASTGTVAIEPQKVKTFAIRPDGASGPSGSQANRTSVPTRAAATQSADATRAPTGAPTHMASIPTPGAATASAPRVRSAYVVQLVSNKSEAEAQSSFKVLQSKYPTVLGNRTALISRVELGDRGTYYRAHVGPFASANQAILCDKLKSAGGQCIVHKN